MRKLNNKGYMLVEIILASVIAFGVAYFIIDLTIKMKNKNDDFFVETQVATDKAIITNKLMALVKKQADDFNCQKLNVTNQTISYDNDPIDIVNEYTNIGTLECHKQDDEISIKIPLTVKQQASRDYDIDINYKYGSGIVDNENPTCRLAVNNNSIVFGSKEDPEGGTGISAYGLVKGTTKTYNSVSSVVIDGEATYTGFVKDSAGNEGKCTATVVASTTTTTYSYTNPFDACPTGSEWTTQSNGCFYWITPYSVADFTGGSGCEANCSAAAGGTCVGNVCIYCTVGYTYSGGLCYKQYSFSECSAGNGTATSSGCSVTNQTSCPSGKTCTSSISKGCNSGYTITQNQNYCYKIN